jgi:ankyrin repeat protein
VSLLLEECALRDRHVGVFVTAPRTDGASPLFIAAQMGHAECVKLLLQHGAEVDQRRLVRCPSVMSHNDRNAR